MTRAIWNDTVLAESDDVIVVDGYTYFPEEAVDRTHLVESPHTSVCAWKGQASYYTVVVDGKENRDAAWYYPAPSQAAARVGGRIGFWRGVEIVPGGSDDLAGDHDDSAGSSDLTAVERRRPGLLARFRRARPASAPVEVASPGRAHASTIVDLDDGSFEAGTEGRWTVVDFWAPWCGPCRAFHPVFEAVASPTPDITFARCNVDTSPQAASAVGVLSIPTVVLFDPAGNEVGRIVGVPPRRELDRLLALPDAECLRP